MEWKCKKKLTQEESSENEIPMEDYLGILKEAHEQLRSRGDSIAVKDITLCSRKKVFSMIDPVPMTDDELYNYVCGQAEHDVIARLFMLNPNRFRTEMEIHYKNIKGKVDVFDKYLNSVIETKTSKMQKFLLKPFKFHEEQIHTHIKICIKKTDNEPTVFAKIENEAGPKPRYVKSIVM